MWYSETLGVIKTPKEFMHNGITYPRQVFRKWGKPELAELGIRPARVVTPDSRYHNTGGENYELVDGEWVISYTTTDKDVDQLKTSMKAKVKSMASSTLSHSDWMRIREEDGGTTMPSDWKTYRSDVRATSNTKEAEIDALEDLDAIKLYESTPGTPNEDGGIPHVNNVTGGWPNDPDYEEEE
jgi:hypothetical protein